MTREDKLLLTAGILYWVGLAAVFTGITFIYTGAGLRYVITMFTVAVIFLALVVVSSIVGRDRGYRWSRGMRHSLEAEALKTPASATSH